MKSPFSGMPRKSSELARRYEAALRRYLDQGQSADFRPVVRLGRQAVALGLETLELAVIHEQALLKLVLPVDPPLARIQVLKRAGMFFAEAITPLEEGHRVAIESNGHLHRMNRALNQRTRELAASNRQLKSEIARRKVVEETLLESKKKTSKLLEQSQLLQDQLRHLSCRILLVQEEERKRISRELHDVVAQLLTGINVRLVTLKMEASVNAKGLGKKISNTQRLVEKSVDIVHRFARELRPALLDDLGLIPALHSYLTSFTKGSGVRASLTAFAGLEKMSSAKRTVLYRVAQEALTNIARHAQASRVEVCIQKLKGAACMSIRDNGKSFEVEKMWQVKANQHLGLLGMRERVEMVGGTFRIESAQGLGTTVYAKIPFKHGVKERARK